MPDLLLETKFHIPPWRSNDVTRPRLLNQLLAGLVEHRKLTLVSAPAGYGKTTLVTSWLHSITEETQSVWLALEKSDNDPVRFLGYLVTAVQRVGDYELDNILGLLDLPQLPPIQNILDEVINSLTSLEGQAVLVLDDYHAITNPIIYEALEYFLDNREKAAEFGKNAREFAVKNMTDRVRAKRIEQIYYSVLSDNKA